MNSHLTASDELASSVALVGMSGRFPGARNIAEYWANLCGGVECVARLTPEELEVRSPDCDLPNYVKCRGILSDVEMFDAELFGFQPREAAEMDPQHRVFLECAWEALEDAGHDPDRFTGMIGVYAGLSLNTYLLNNLCASRGYIRRLLEAHQMGTLPALLGNDKDFLTTRVSYKLNLKGPSITLQSACSTSLVAVCQAYHALLSYQCDMALAGGVSISFPQKRGYLYQEGAMVSSDGHCRPFDAAAQGTVFGAGAGVVVLRRLEDALRDGDQVYAIIRGAALNNDGSGKVSYMAPSVEGQAHVISMAQMLAGVNPRSIGYVEAHGTGTPLGDPIEIAGLTQAFRRGTRDTGFCALGSVKSNVGHLEVAAGIAGLIKTALVLRHRQIPPTLHYQRPNPHIDFGRTPFFVNATLRDWPEGEYPRRAGVSSFGVGGTNAHVVLEEARPSAPSTPGREAELLVWSARTPEARERLGGDLSAHLENHPGLNLGDMAFTLQQGRRPLNCRRFLVVRDAADAARRLGAPADKGTSSQLEDRREPSVAFLFPGQGVQSVNMGRALYETVPCVRRAVDQCCEILREPLELDLREILYPAAGVEEIAQRRLTETWLTQPALFVVEYALAQFWISLGVRPQAMLGHSVGEYVAACLAEVFSLENALQLLAARARMMQDLPSGSMLAVRLPENRLMELLPGDLSLAAVNAPSLCVVSGPSEAVEEWQARLGELGVASKQLLTSHAFHSAMMDPIREPFTELVRQIPRSEPRVPYLSNVTSRWITSADIGDPGYWFQHLRQPVRFADGVGELWREPRRLLLEVGPQQTLSVLARQHPAKAAGQIAVSCMPSSGRESEWTSWLQSVGQLWIAGQPIEWRNLHQDLNRRRVSLPTYPFQRKRHWVEPAPDSEPVETRISVVQSVTGTVPASEPSVAATASMVPGADYASGRKMHLMAGVRGVMGEISGLPEGDLIASASFVELGFDSLLLTQASQALQRKFGVKVAFRQLADGLSSVDALVDYLDRALPSEQPISAPASGSAGSVAGQPGTGQSVARSDEVKRPGRSAGEDLKRFGPFRGIEIGPKGGLTPDQQQALTGLIARYNRRTPGSKAYAQRHRDYFCDPRAAGNFRQLWKEMVYPIVCERSQGGRIWDIDGNEYVDVTLGFGANYFGHRPEFVVRALDDQLRKGFEIGPQSPLAGEVARMLCEMTGMERSTFCNTGSEAVMAAIRVARTVTGRDKVVYFTGDYHGIFDEALGHAGVIGGLPGARPIAPGIPPLPNVMVLDYGSESSLELIRRHASEVAAVLVEPVQSRHPDLQPREFLHALRRLTQEQGIALIFDEVVTGFRAAPGGAQEFFGVRADLATYGKVIGGGMPIGVLAGEKRFMDALDGGAWQFGDESYPEVGVTFFAGTFVRHPLAMAAANATLRYLKEAGPDLQRQTTAKTAELAGTLNRYFEEVEVPIRLQTFSSIFYYDFHPDLKYASLLFYYLRERGIHVWEGRVGQVCTAHTEEDLERVVTAFRESVEAMQIGGFFPSKPRSLGVPARSVADRVPEFHPLSEAQREMWLGAQMCPEAAGPHHACTGLWLEGPLNITHLRHAIERVLDRHESLRGTFSADGTGILVQPTLPGGEILFVEDLSALGEAERDARVDGVLHEEGRRFLDLERGPLVSFRLLKVSFERHLLVFTAQMIVCDGWSHYVVFEDLGEIYSALASGAEPVLKPSISISDFMREQQRHATSDEARQNEAFWLEQFRTLPPALNLPTSRPRPPVRTVEAARCNVVLDAALCLQIRRVAREQRNSYFALLLAAFEVWVSRLSNCRDLVVGVPFAAQAPLGMDPYVGQCANTLPLRTFIDPAWSVAELLSRTWTCVLDAKEHWDFTFGQVAAKLDLPRDRSRIPLVSVLFNLDPPMSKVRFDGLKHRFFTGPRYYYQYDLGFNLVEGPETIDVECDFNTKLFDAEVVRAWMAGYETLVRAMVADVRQPLNRLPMVEARAAQRLLEAEKGRPQAHPRPRGGLHELVADQASMTPENTAVEDGDLSWSYRELMLRANQIAAQLRIRGVGSGDLVGVCLDRTVRVPAALLAVLSLGAACVPWDPAGAGALAALARGRLRLLIVDASSEAQTVSVEVPRARIEELIGERLGKRERAEVNLSVAPEQLACVIQTAGTTGKPDLVDISHGCLVNLLFALRDKPGFVSEDVLLATSPVSTVRSLAELWLPLIAGGKLVIAPTSAVQDSSTVARLLTRHQITVLPATPARWERLLQGGWKGNQRLKAWSSGEALRQSLADRLLPLCAELWNLYGTAETGGYCLGSRVRPGVPIALGEPIAECSVRIADDALQPLPVGVPGELLVSENLAVTCHGRADRFVVDATAGMTVRWFRTGDQARHTVDGRMEYVGRTDSEVMLRGFRIRLDAIEETLLRHASVRQAVAIVREDATGDKNLVAYVVPKDGGLCEATVREFLREQLPDYMLPCRIAMLDQLPLTTAGTVDRRKLPEPPDAADAGEVEQTKLAFAAPRSPTESALASIWAQVLGTKRLGIHDNFFDLGGQSMLAMRAVMLAGRNGVPLGPRSIFQHPTIAELAKVVDEALAHLTGSESSEPPVGPVPLTPAQIRFLCERENLDPHRWNFSVLMEADRLNSEALRMTLEALVAHHDALRLRIAQQCGEWSQHIEESAGPVAFESHDLAGLTVEAQRECLETICAGMQSSLNLSQGPVLRVGHFRCAPVQADRLFFTLHHFVMDVLSWGIFWEDFETVYGQVLEGRAPKVPAKTTSFRQWSLRLRELAESGPVRKTIPGWLGLPWSSVKPLPLDFPAAPHSNTNKCAESCELFLSGTDSLRILRPSGDARTEDILLMALARTLSEWGETTAALIDVLGHGRGIVEDANLSRTVGFMLCYQPMLMHFEHGDDPTVSMQAMLQQIRQLPEGFTFDLLRLFSSIPSVRDAFGKLPRAEVLFNFTGEELETVEPQSTFRRSADACGSDYDPRNGRYYPLAVSGAIVGGCLRFRMVYSRNLHRRESIEQLLCNFSRNLRAIVSVEPEKAMVGMRAV